MDGRVRGPIGTAATAALACARASVGAVAVGVRTLTACSCSPVGPASECSPPTLAELLEGCDRGETVHEASTSGQTKKLEVFGNMDCAEKTIQEANAQCMAAGVSSIAANDILAMQREMNVSQGSSFGRKRVRTSSSTEDVTQPGNVQQNQESNNNLPPRFTTEEITFLRSLDQAEPSNNEDSTRNTKIQPPIAKKRVSWFFPPPTDLLEVPQSTMVFAEPDESGITIENVSNEQSTTVHSVKENRERYTSSEPPIATVSHPSALTTKTPTDGSREGETNKAGANWQGAIKGIKTPRQYTIKTARHFTIMGHNATYPRLRMDPHFDDRRTPGPTSLAEAILPARDQAGFQRRRCIQGRALINPDTNEILCGSCARLEEEEDLQQFHWGPQHYLIMEDRAWHATRCTRCRSQVLTDRGNENCTGCLRAYLAVPRAHRPAYPRLRAAPPRFEIQTTDTGTQTGEEEAAAPPSQN
ncbi:hypothetical protein WN55_04267 [Dufourea novaeangliae]|uniref:Uncharacterized protein n=1 Tax=Dufourea novaeangliae TaxID=178035 RepID=A0A154PMS2_DUFNO|nr:hypothetical protein WN55_04267 [Dufourea novaeangliae]